MTRKKPTRASDHGKSEQLISQAMTLALSADEALADAGDFRIKDRPVEGLRLSEEDRAALAAIPRLRRGLKARLAKPDAALTVADAAEITQKLVDGMAAAEPKRQATLLRIARTMMDCVDQNLDVAAAAAKKKKSTPTDAIYQFKITLIGTRPPVWRRIQVKDCTLDQLHEHIQLAMGWTNSHLHHFRDKDQLYGDPDLMEENFDEMEYADSTTTLLSDILPKTRKRFRIIYEYDFGDSWEHEVLFEGRVPAEPGRKYPLCLGGARACPPEDVGGVWGYADFVDAIKDPEHERHEEFREWMSGEFDPEAFDAAAATKAMRKGLPNWRDMD
jgi:hypothetical protein